LGWLKKKEPRPAGLKHLKVAPAADDGDKFRALSDLADAASNRAKAREFSIQESRARRFWHDKPIGGVGSTGKFWSGVALEAGSDYGRSITRPIAIWIVSIFVFATYYLARGDLKPGSSQLNSALPSWIGDAPEFAKTFIAQIYGFFSTIAELDCAIGGGGAWQQTLDFSLKTSLLRVLPSGELISENFTHCLFGARQGVSVASQIPLDVSFVAAGQIGMSMFLIALFAHALWMRIRNG